MRYFDVMGFDIKCKNCGNEVDLKYLDDAEDNLYIGLNDETYLLYMKCTKCGNTVSSMPELSDEEIIKYLEEIATHNYEIANTDKYEGDFGKAYEDRELISIYDCEECEYAGFHDLTVDETCRTSVDPIEYYGKKMCMMMIMDYILRFGF